ncbi:MAG TPA: hypothetical protein VMI55_05765 [Thermoplasmata archaeon]|nr:hypothetical protein [Thermoplasmata archaeon]
MAAAEAGAVVSHAPVAVVWCRQVDNEAESPGYTTIPDDFPGRRETLETIRIVGNLTVNVADTHDYWDPDPSQPLSYYPNLFLYPAAGGRYTCVGRMFLSTEDRPRIGMKTLVFETAALVASGEFGSAVIRAHATMGGRSSPDRPAAEPDQSVYQNVGEGFLFHRGSTEPVLLVCAEQWEAANQVTLDLVAHLPTALVALGAFLVFPYFLPVGKVDVHQFTEQLPLALAVMRVPKGEAQGERHAKRVQGWDSAPITLRDLTRPPTGRTAKDALPLVLQYARDHAEEKLGEVSRRVDLVEGPRLSSLLHDVDRQSGRDRRKEMWRTGTAMETAALLLSRPRGRTVSSSGEAAKRANQYVRARPDSDRGGPAPPAASAAMMPEVTPQATSQLPPWLMRPVDVTLPPSGPVAVPVSVQVDPSLLRAGVGPELTGALAPAPEAPAPAPSAPPIPPANGSPAPAEGPSPPPLATPPTVTLPSPVAAPPPTPARAGPDPRALAAVDAAEERVRSTLETRLKEVSEGVARAIAQTRVETGARLAALEARPAVAPADVAKAVEEQVHQAMDPRLAEIPNEVQRAVKNAGDAWTASFRSEIERITKEMDSHSSRTEEELRAALVAQLDLELAEAKEQGSALRESIEGRVRTLIDTRLTELEARRTKDVRELEQRLGLLLEGRSKDLESRVTALLEVRAGALDHQLETVLEGRTKELESRVARQLEARAGELQERRGREADLRLAGALDARAKEAEGRVNALLEARAKELEARISNQLSMTRAALDERLTQFTKRFDIDREARLSEISDTHSKSLAGLQVRMQAYLDQKMREDADRERTKYVELLARLKGEVDDALGRTMDSTRFDEAVRDRVDRAVDQNRRETTRALTELETRLKAGSGAGSAERLVALEKKLQERAETVAELERKVQQDVEDLDRRVQVVTDKMVPLVRKTWVRIEELEKKLGRADDTEVRFGQLRRDLGRELRRIETELHDEQTHLRRRVEGSMSNQNKVWLNLIRQLSEAGAGYVPAEADLRSERLRREGSRPIDPEDEDLLGRPRSRESPYVDFSEEPANPLDPEPPSDRPTAGRRPPVRRTRDGA